MKTFILKSLLVGGFILGSAALMRAENPPKPAKKPYAEEHEMTSFRQTGPSLAQDLVDSLPKKYPDIQYGLIHALLLNSPDHAVIASHNPDQIGALDSDFDNAVSDRKIMFINPRKSEGYSRSVVKVPMTNSAGQPVRASWAFYFPAKPGDTQAKLLARAMAIRDDLAKQIPDLKALYEKAPQ